MKANSTPEIVPVTDAELGSALALLESLRGRPEDDVPWPRVTDIEELRYRLARDERESGPRWYAACDPEAGGLEGLAGYDAGASGRAGQVYLDGPAVWIDRRRHGIASALLTHVMKTVFTRLGDVELLAAVGEKNLAGAAFLEHHGFVLRDTRRTLVCRDAHTRKVDIPPGVAIVTPADDEELQACAALLAREHRQPPLGLGELVAASLDRRTVLRMALAGHLAVGFVWAELDPQGETAWVDHLTCDSGWREYGIESILLAHLLNDCFEEPRVTAVRAELVTSPGTHPRREHSYEGMGFGLERADLGYSYRRTQSVSR